MDEQELRAKMMELQIIEQQMKQMQKQINSIEQQAIELNSIEDNLEELKNTKKGNEIMVPVATGIFMKAEIKDTSELLVNVGSNVAVKKSIDDSKKLISEQRIELGSIKEQMFSQLEKLSSKAMEIEDELVKAQGS